MTIYEGFYQVLAADAGVIALVGTTPPRLHYGNRPQGETEASVVLQLISEVQGAVFDGPAPYATGTFRLNCFAETLLQAGDLADAVKTAVNGFTGTTTGGFKFGSILIGNKTEIPRLVPAGQSGPRVFGVLVDAQFLSLNS